jgi:hypothetical protein
MASTTLPRPSRKGNLANIVILYLSKSGHRLPTKERKHKRKRKGESKYQGTNSGTYLARLEMAMLAGRVYVYIAWGYMVGLAAEKL